MKSKFSVAGGALIAGIPALMKTGTNTRHCWPKDIDVQMPPFALDGQAQKKFDILPPLNRSNMRYLILLLFMISGCNTHYGDMTAETMRAAIDNCKDNNLNIQVYQRSDRSIIDIRCLPKKDDVHHTVTIRKRVKLPILRVLTEQMDILETD